LLAANMLHRAGWDVQVFERAAGALEGRGAGITILPGLIAGFQAAGVDATERSLGLEMSGRIAIDRAGNIVAKRPFHQFMTSWRRLFEALKTAFPADRYHSGTGIEQVDQSHGTVRARFADGTQVEGDFLVAADGLRSTLRGQFLPEVKPAYSGYIAWRCLCDESRLSAPVKEILDGRYVLSVAPGEQAIGYAVPAPGHGAERQFNLVWYTPAREEELVPLLTDESGRHHPNGISPGLIASRVRADMIDKARRVLSPQFAEVVERSAIAFFQPIYDLASPRMVFDHVAIIVDAAFVARPHGAMGIPKAAGDAVALFKALTGGDEAGGLRAFEAERLRIDGNIVARGRYLGSYLAAQSGSEEERRRVEAERDYERAMMETAAPYDYDALRSV
jgi:2-polyprenyl-6-methoxyphenol hydroxylase-like FAD-dependent oxidoreductase